MIPLNFSPFPILVTKRLNLRQLTLNDAQPLYQYQSDKSNFEFVDMPVYTSIDQVNSYIESRNLGVQQNQYIIWAIELNNTKDIIGTISLWNFVKENNKAEFGYGLFPEYRGNGYMTEALKRVCQYGFYKLELDEIEAYTNAKNIPSRNLLINNGFTYMKTIKEKTLIGDVMEMAVFRKESHALLFSKAR
jgi:ribosomal-protein-alanine N-acetyltransferase